MYLLDLEREKSSSEIRCTDRAALIALLFLRAESALMRLLVVKY